MAVDEVAGDAELDGFRRSSMVLTTGELLVMDFFEGKVAVEDGELDAMVDSVDPAVVVRVLPRLKEVAGRSREYAVRAADAVVREFSEGEPSEAELAEGRVDLVPQSLEALAEGTVVVHLEDRCGGHFLEGYWPAVHFDAAGAVTRVSVEA